MKNLFLPPKKQNRHAYTKLTILFFISIVFIYFISCNKNSNGDNSYLLANYEKFIAYSDSGYTIQYFGNFENALLDFIIKIDKGNKEILNEKMLVNFSDSQYIEKLEKDFTQRANRLSKDFSREDADNLFKVFYYAVNNTDYSKDENYPVESKEVQGFFMSYSLVCALQRKVIADNFSPQQFGLRKKDEIEYETTNTIDRGYIEGKNSFILEEDIVVNIAGAKEMLMQKPEVNEDADMKQASSVLFEYLENSGKNRMTFKGMRNRIVELEKLMVIEQSDSSKRKNNGFRFSWGCLWNNPFGWGISGSDMGCCSNYSGCCVLASIACLIHDMQCYCCEHGWYCLPGCVPEPNCGSGGSRGGYCSGCDGVPRAPDNNIR